MFTISLEATGIEAAEQLLQTALGVGSVYTAADLVGTARQPGGKTNRDIVEYLSAMGLDVIPTDDETAEKIGQAFAEEVEKRLEVQAAKQDYSAAGAANTIGAAAWRAAMKQLRQLAVERIEGRAVGTVDPDYATRRAEQYGVADDNTIVGVASGQLLSDLNPSGSKATVKLHKA